MKKEDFRNRLAISEKKDRTGKIRYSYFLKGIEGSYDKIEDYFNNGIPNWTCCLEGIVKPIKDEDLLKNGLEKIIKDYAYSDTDYESVLLVKIPTDYLANVQKGNGLIEPPIPLFYASNYAQYGLREMLLDPALIKGAFIKRSESYILNDNFNPIFDPTGHKYAEEQIENLSFLNKQDWLIFAQFRKETDCDSLNLMDVNMHKFESEMEYYREKFDIGKDKGKQKIKK